MERYKAKKLAESVGLIFVGGDPVGDHFVDKMTQFASLVEQETLERAARLAKAYLQHGYDVTGNLELHEAILHKDFQDF